MSESIYAARQTPLEHVYVSGAITHATKPELRLFNEAGRWLVSQGHDVFIPPEVADVPTEPRLTKAKSSRSGWNDALSRDVGKIATVCTAICVLPTVEKSRGALLEVFIALSLQRKFILLPWQHPSWEQVVRHRIEGAIEYLYRDIPAQFYLHHDGGSDLNEPLGRDISRR